MCTEAVRNAMAATRCAVVVFKRVYYLLVQTSSGDRVASMVAEWFSMHERLIIFQSVSKNMSLRLEEELKRKVWESLAADGEALLNSEWEQHRYNGDIHKILSLLILGLYGVEEPVRGETAIVYAARSEVSSILVPRHLCRVQCPRKSY